MPYYLDSFAKQAPPALLRAAMAHVAAGQVHNLERDGIEWLAEVADSSGGPYDVAVAIGPKGELLATCTCGDEEHDLCRHAVATLLAAGAREEAHAPARSRAKTKAKSKVKKASKPAQDTPAGRLRAALDTASHDSLVNLMITLSKRDKVMQNLILLELTDVGASMESFRAAAKIAVHPPGGWQAWDDAKTLKVVAGQVDRLAERIELALIQGDVENAVRMTIIMLGEVVAAQVETPLFVDIGDSDEKLIAILGENIDILSPQARKETFNSLLRVAQLAHMRDPRFVALVGFLAIMVETPAQRRAVEPLLAPTRFPDALHGPDVRYDEYANHLLALHFGLIATMDGPEAAVNFARSNLRFIGMRSVLIEEARKREDWNTVNELAREGVRVCKANGVPEMVDFFSEMLIEAQSHSASQDVDPRLMKLQAYPTAANYQLWKASVPADSWPTARANLFAGNTLPLQVAYDILVAEEAWQDLINWALQNLTDMRNVSVLLHNHGAVLAARFPVEVARLCDEGIMSQVNKISPNRNDYRAVAALLERMKVLGLKEQARRAAQQLRAIYPNRPALLKEIVGI